MEDALCAGTKKNCATVKAMLYDKHAWRGRSVPRLCERLSGAGGGRARSVRSGVKSAIPAVLVGSTGAVLLRKLLLQSTAEPFSSSAPPPAPGAPISNAAVAELANRASQIWARRPRRTPSPLPIDARAVAVVVARARLRGGCVQPTGLLRPSPLTATGSTPLTGCGSRSRTGHRQACRHHLPSDPTAQGLHCFTSRDRRFRRGHRRRGDRSPVHAASTIATASSASTLPSGYRPRHLLRPPSLCSRCSTPGPPLPPPPSRSLDGDVTHRRPPPASVHWPLGLPV
ncbi:hypothetical protein E2562_013253 [Oryza meyeriana var. granulata]|uniref:Uncharacterized protein n=1 Tax=Oryza meyeriana var. granulata TaxID=110450 RepID=A0A6G1D379_9ORYZ|nr:hypothetical protein E2562_013253 [Oryza meyeriana var. granulata]